MGNRSKLAVVAIVSALVLSACGKLEQDLVKTDDFELKMVAVRVGPVMLPILIPASVDNGDTETRTEYVQAPGVTLPGTNTNTVTVIPTAYNVVKADKVQCKHGGLVLHVWVDMDADGVYKPTIDQGLTSTLLCLDKKDKDKKDKDKDKKDKDCDDDKKKDKRGKGRK